METDPKNRYKCKSADESRNIDDTYIFDPGTGIYKPKTIETDQERTRKQAGTNRRSRFFTDPKTDWRPILIATFVSLLTVALLVATVHYTRLQWLEMKKAATASKRSADDADKSLLKSEEFFKRDQRAYVYVRLIAEKNNGFTEWPISVTAHIGVNFQAVNSGKTPANDTQHFGLVSFQESNKIEGESRAFEKASRDTRILRKNPLTVEGGAPVLPGVSIPNTFFTISTIVIGLPPLWTSDEISDIATSAPKRFVYVAGTIEYRDVFNELHVTEYCARWSNLNSNWEFCQTHNKIE
jgi:hypothetical protein